VRTDQENEIAAVTGGTGQLRASHADREIAVDVLKDAFVQGRLTRDELDTRVGQALAAKTCARLTALTADLRVTSIAADSGREPAQERTRPRAGSAGAGRAGAGKSAAGAVIAACVAAVAVLAAAGAQWRPGPDAVACQSFYVWAQQGNGDFDTMLLDFSAAAASQGPDHTLTRDLQALRQVALQYENPAGLPPSASASASRQYVNQSRVDAAIARVDAACMPYSN
jgi:Domain of unknown function (DUF1707)